MAAGDGLIRQIVVPSSTHRNHRGVPSLATLQEETLNPLIGGNKFSAINENPPKYELGKLLVDTSDPPVEECCGNDRWLILDRKLVPIQGELLRNYNY